MKSKRVAVEHSLWKKLRALDKAATKRYLSDFFPGFGPLGLILHPRLKRCGYWCDPTNCLTFASTGGDGVHFSFVVRDGKVTEKSPVVITVPVGFDHPNLIGGESLFDFLCLGYHRGYFALETASADAFFQAYASSEWQPTENWHYAVGYGVDEQQRRLLNFLIAKLGLRPWKDLKRKFERLQKLYIPLLEMPEGGQGSG